MTCITLLLIGTVVYAAANVQGWVGGNEPTAAGKPTCTGPASKRVLSPREVTINVYNATSQRGLAASAARSLEEQGFRVATIDNDPLGRTIPSLGEIRHGVSGTASAVLAATRLPGAQMVLDNRIDTSVDLVLGNKFKTLRALSKSAAAKAAKAVGRC